MADQLQQTIQITLKRTHRDGLDQLIAVENTFRKKVENCNITKRASIKVFSTNSTGLVRHLILETRSTRTGTKDSGTEFKQKTQLTRASAGNDPKNNT